MGPGISRWVGLNVAPLDEPLHERESVAQGGHGDVSMIFAALLRQRGDQVVEDEFQLRACASAVARSASSVRRTSLNPAGLVRNATLGGTGAGTCLPASSALVLPDAGLDRVAAAPRSSIPRPSP